MMGALIDTVIKIKYISMGYLPNYPYHLISDAEMVNAFLPNNLIIVDKDGNKTVDSSVLSFFSDMYPCPDPTLNDPYFDLIAALRYHLDKFVDSHGIYTIPDWVYSYMIGAVIGENSSTDDKHDLLTLMNLDNVDDNWTPEAAQYAYKISKIWIAKLASTSREHRAPTMFGEPHVIKYLRLNSSEVI